MKNLLIIFLIFLLPIQSCAQKISNSPNKDQKPIVISLFQISDINKLSTSQQQILKDQLQSDRYEIYFKGTYGSKGISSIYRFPANWNSEFTSVGLKIINDVKKGIHDKNYKTYQKNIHSLLEYHLPNIFKAKGYNAYLDKSLKDEFQKKKNMIQQKTEYLYSLVPVIYLEVWTDEVGDSHFYGVLVVFPEKK